MKKSVSILGCGWLGFPLAVHFVMNGYEVLGSSTTLSRCDDLTAEGVKSFCFSVSEYGIDGEFGTFFLSDILIITVPFLRTYLDPFIYTRLVKQILTFVQPNTKIVFTSSTSIYGDVCECVSELSSINFSTDRQRALYDAEQYVLSHHGIVLRLGGLYGWDRHIRNQVPYDKAMNVVHGEDVIAVIKRCLDEDVQSNVYNVVCDDHRTKGELFSVEGFARKPSKIVSNQRLKQELGFVFKYPKVCVI